MSYSGESGHKADAGAIIERIESKLEKIGINSENAADPRALNWDNPDHRRRVREKFADSGASESLLPGFGSDGHASNARNDCGDPHPFVCDSCGHQVDFGRTCGQSVCARCAVAWCRDLAINKSAKVRRVRKEKHHHTPSQEHQKLHHQIISPSLGWFFDLATAGYSLEEAQEITREIVKDILSEMRAQGVLVRHSYRGADDDGSIASESDDQGEWKQRLFSGRNWWNDVRDDLAWKPHYHCVVVADYLKGGELTERVERETGWVIHRIADDRNVSLKNDGAMARALTYSLSHADIMVRDDGHNRSAVWEVGAFQGDAIKSSGRFSAKPSDLDWADRVVREAATTVLGLAGGTTECGVTIPAVDDPDELARRVIAELYPADDRRNDVDEDLVLHHVAEGNIGVDVTTSSGGGGSVTVTDAFGDPIGADGWSGGNLPDVPNVPLVEAADEPIATVADVDDDHDDCDHDDRDDQEGGADGCECDGQLVPLGEARRRGFLDDDEWCRDAPHVDEARDADREWPDDLEPWRATSPGKSVGAG